MDIVTTNLNEGYNSSPLSPLRSTKLESPLSCFFNLILLRNVDCVKGTFDCSFILSISWEKKDVYKNWEPELYFPNSITTTISMNKSKTFFKNNMIHQNVYVSGKFAEHYELDQFPFDSQRLHIHIKFVNCPVRSSRNSVSSDEQFNFMPFPNSENNFTNLTYSVHSADSNQMILYSSFYLDQVMGCIINGSFIDRFAWELINDIHIGKSITNPILDPKRISYCKIIAKIDIERKLQHYFYYFVLPLFIQTSLAFTTVFLPYEELGNKMQITLNILLTMFAIKFASVNYIPSVACVTHLEKYFIMCSLAVGSIIVQNVIIYLSSLSEIVYIANYSSGICLFALSTLYQMLFSLCLFSKNVRKFFFKRLIENKTSYEESSFT